MLATLQDLTDLVYAHSKMRLYFGVIHIHPHSEDDFKLIRISGYYGNISLDLDGEMYCAQKDSAGKWQFDTGFFQADGKPYRLQTDECERDYDIVVEKKSDE